MTRLLQRILTAWHDAARPLPHERYRLPHPLAPLEPCACGEHTSPAASWTGISQGPGRYTCAHYPKRLGGCHP